MRCCGRARSCASARRPSSPSGPSETEIRFRRDGELVVEQTAEPTRRLHELTAEAIERGEELERLEVRRPTLEDVYIELTAETEAEAESSA